MTNHLLEPHEVVKYGFELPADPIVIREDVPRHVKAARTQVTRVTSLVRRRDNRLVMDRVLAVTTATDSIQINVTPSGLIRVYDDRGKRVR